MLRYVLCLVHIALEELDASGVLGGELRGEKLAPCLARPSRAARALPVALQRTSWKMGAITLQGPHQLQRGAVNSSSSLPRAPAYTAWKSITDICWESEVRPTSWGRLLRTVIDILEGGR